MRRLALLSLLGAAYGAGPSDAPTLPSISESYYLARLRPHGADIDVMTPTVLSPLGREDVPCSCPDRLVVCTSPKGYEEAVRPYLDALGSVRIGGGGGGGVAKEAAQKLEATFKELSDRARGEVKEPIVRVFFKQYPRERSELPGERAVTLHATIYSVPDLYFDRASLTIAHAPDAMASGRLVPGVMVDIRKTWRFTSRGPRLIEATVEASRDVRHATRGARLGDVAGDASVAKIASDSGSIQHFELYHGERWGFAWFDRAAEGDPDVWAKAYHIPYSADRPAPAETESLPPATVEALLALVAKA